MTRLEFFAKCCAEEWDISHQRDGTIRAIERRHEPGKTVFRLRGYFNTLTGGAKVDGVDGDRLNTPIS